MGPVVIAAGGTGGHFFPAEAFAAELRARGQRFVLMCDARTAGRGGDAFGERFVLAGGGIAGHGALRAARGAFGIARGVAQARRALRRRGARVVVAFGGYPAIAPVLAAWSLGIPAVLHEQNAVLGRANRALSRVARLLTLSMEATQSVPNVATRVVGNPVRGGIAHTPYVAGHDVLVLGGSLGAHVFADAVPAALAALPFPVRVVQQCRAEDLDRVRAAYDAAGIEAELATFFPDVAARLSAATLVIARSGASTVAELALAGRPAVLVPLPHAIDDHQAANARVLADAGGAWIVRQDAIGTLPALLAELLADPGHLTRAAAAARTMARPNAASDLADAVDAVLA